jgi:dual specificity phosphatase 12
MNTLQYHSTLRTQLEMADDKDCVVYRSGTCRILVIGSHRTRLEKVFSFLRYSKDLPNSGVAVEYIPCVATFSSYNEVATEKSIRYLSSVDCYLHNPADGTLCTQPSSVLPFFDETESDDNFHDDRAPLFSGVSGAAIGSGIDDSADIARIESFLESMASNLSQKKRVKIRTIEPNAGFNSMKEELDAYKAMSSEEKQEVYCLQTMGPAKMAKLVADFATEMIRAAVCGRFAYQQATDVDVDSLSALPESNADFHSQSAATIPVIDPNNDCFACRMCRTILFGVADLQDPAHEPSQHMFSYRKRNHGACSISPGESCQSYFLQDSLEWMGDDIKNGYPEGKFHCPTCNAKVGNWIWSGTQCSCGTWVVPAIQIPNGKVDVLTPRPLASHSSRPIEQDQSG